MSAYNLSILDFKSLQEHCQGQHHILIIYPYWILNLPVSQKAHANNWPYNLSILDFKSCISGHCLLRRKQLIIYPYWILNLSSMRLTILSTILIIYPYQILKVSIPVLLLPTFSLIIYPYWILNYLLRDLSAGTTAYNLSILDFKYSFCFLSAVFVAPYNLSILDFK